MESLRTERMVLRRWRAEDEEPMAAINRDPEVQLYLNRPVDEDVVSSFYQGVTGHWERHGYGPWALDYGGRFIGFAGLFQLPPALAAAGNGPELGWRLSRSLWGRGLATEAAAAAAADALYRLKLKELISVIHPDNERSQRVASKLGMAPTRQIENPLLGIPVDVWTAHQGCELPLTAG